MPLPAHWTIPMTAKFAEVKFKWPLMVIFDKENNCLKPQLFFLFLFKGLLLSLL